MAIILPGRKSDVPKGNSPVGSANHFIGLTNLSEWSPTTGEPTTAYTSPEIRSPMPWDELVVSWNATLPPESGIEFEASAIHEDNATKFYSLGRWSERSTVFPRESVLNQKDEDGDVKTDTLVLSRPAHCVQLRLTVGGGDRSRVRLRFVGLSFFSATAKPAPMQPNYSAWGKAIDVPQRSQLAYEGGRGWCSPACVSMVLAHWASVLNRPELDVEVPQVARAVHDPNWPGTGNWPFNTAFAGRADGMRAYVARLDDLAELEEWIKAGVPVPISVPLDLLNGRRHEEGSGHLIVCVGFTEQGDAVVNDPWAELAAGEKVRKLYPRKNIVNAWKTSKSTVYLIYPESAKIPANRGGHWESR